MKQKINIENDILVGLCQKRDLGQLSQSDLKEITSREATLRMYKAKLKQKEAERKRQQKSRVNQKRKTESIEEQIREKLSKKSQEKEKHVGNEELIRATSRIAISGSAANKRRQSEIIITVKTLDQLTEALNREGYNLKKSSVYLRLLPKNGRTREGKNSTSEVNFVQEFKTSKLPVHKTFARTTINALQELAGLLRPGLLGLLGLLSILKVIKLRCQFGIMAASKQVPLLMHMEHEVTLLYHDYVMAPQDKLIPSVIGDMRVREKDFSGDAVTYIGPTYCAMRSAKHSR